MELSGAGAETGFRADVHFYKTCWAGEEKTMIMAIDMGNTNIVIGCIDDEKIYFVERLSTDTSKT